jgi:DNA mismatch repair protein MutL
MQVPYFIYFEVEPADIDVNIHPTKTEIKFENEQSIWQILSAAVKDAIGRFCEVPAIEFDTEGRPDIPVFNPQRDSITMPKVEYNPNYNPFKSRGTQSTQNSQNVQNWQTLYEEALKPRQQEQTMLFEDEPVLTPTAPEYLLAEKSPSHYQYKGQNIMTAVRSGLMIIDQHRADIRILYERYMKQLSQRQSSTQRLLFPEVLKLSPTEDVVMQQLLPELSNIGFELSSLGGFNYSIAGVPSGMEGMSPVKLVHDLVADAVDAGHTAVEAGQQAIEKLHATIAISRTSGALTVVTFPSRLCVPLAAIT